MEREHLSVETMARWLAGDLAHEEVLRHVAGHLVARCPRCRAARDEVDRLQREVEHWDEKVAVFEGRQAPGLLAEIDGLSLDEQLARVRGEERFQTWGLCRLLLRRSFEAGLDDPGRAVGLAEVAVAVAELLVEDAYDPHWIEDLRARSWAHLGNARRILGELWSAEAAFRRAEVHAGRSTTGNLAVTAELLDFRASLRRAQRRLAESRELLEAALALYRELGDRHRVGRCLISMAKVLEESGLGDESGAMAAGGAGGVGAAVAATAATAATEAGGRGDDLERAVALLAEAEALIDRERDPRLLLCARHNRVWLLATAGRGDEAAALLPEARALSGELGNALDLVRLRWAEGRIDLGAGRAEAAERTLREVQQELLSRRMGYDAALASLDLALLYAQQGRTAELRRLAAETLPVFESREVHREAMAALLLFQHAAEDERLTVELVRHLAAYLARERRPSA